MNIDNITSDSMVLTNDGKAILIKVYEEEIERLTNRITELEKGVSRKEEQITNLDDENFDLENEIERLNNKNEELLALYTTERNVKEDYKAIIKEAIEYTEENSTDYWNKENNKLLYRTINADNLLEILDKGVKNNESN